MTKEELTPIYVANTLEHEGKKLKIFIMELPSNEIINMLDLTGVFVQSIVYQVYEIIKYLLQHKDDDLKIKYDFDGILLTFIKHYKGTTQTIVLSSLDDVVNKYNDFNITNKLIKHCTPTRKYNVKAIIEGTSVIFDLLDKDKGNDKYKCKDNILEEWSNLKHFF